MAARLEEKEAVKLQCPDCGGLAKQGTLVIVHRIQCVRYER